MYTVHAAHRAFSLLGGGLRTTSALVTRPPRSPFPNAARSVSQAHLRHGSGSPVFLTPSLRPTSPCAFYATSNAAAREQARGAEPLPNEPHSPRSAPPPPPPPPPPPRPPSWGVRRRQMTKYLGVTLASGVLLGGAGAAYYWENVQDGTLSMDKLMDRFAEMTHTTSPSEPRVHGVLERIRKAEGEDRMHWIYTLNSVGKEASDAPACMVKHGAMEQSLELMRDALDPYTLGLSAEMFMLCTRCPEGKQRLIQAPGILDDVLFPSLDQLPKRLAATEVLGEYNFYMLTLTQMLAAFTILVENNPNARERILDQQVLQKTCEILKRKSVYYSADQDLVSARGPKDGVRYGEELVNAAQVLLETMSPFLSDDTLKSLTADERRRLAFALVDRAHLYVQLASLSEKKEEKQSLYRRAMENTKQSAKLSGSTTALFNVATQALKDRCFFDAETALRTALQLQPEDLDSRLALAQLLPRRGGKYREEALQLLQTLKRPARDATFAKSYEIESLILLSLNRVVEARAAARKALALNANDPELKYNLARCLLKKAHNEKSHNVKLAREASALLDDVLSVDPNRARAHLHLSIAYNIAGDPNKALEQAQRAVSLESSNALFLEHLAEIHFQSKRYGECKKFFLEAAAIDKDRPLVLYRLSQLELLHTDSPTESMSHLICLDRLYRCLKARQQAKASSKNHAQDVTILIEVLSWFERNRPTADTGTDEYRRAFDVLHNNMLRLAQHSA